MEIYFDHDNHLANHQGRFKLNIRTCFIFLTLAVVFVLGGCAGPRQLPVELNQDSVSAKAGRIGVASTALPKVDTHLPGAGCLLCMAAASVANSSLTTYANTLPYEDLPKLKDLIADQLRKKGLQVVVIPEDIRVDALDDYKSETPNTARKNYSPLQKKYNVDRVLVVSIQSLGFIRTYSSYIPTSDPKGMLEGLGYIVNLSNNSYEWYLPVNITRSADKTWDEPPKFPGLTNTYFQVLELGKDAFLGPFSK
jgi:hypothetical protein